MKSSLLWHVVVVAVIDVVVPNDLCLSKATR